MSILQSIYLSGGDKITDVSALGNITKDFFRNTKIRILKPHIISKYKLDDDFEFMEKLKNDIQITLKNQEETTKQMMSLVLNQIMKLYQYQVMKLYRN